MAHNMILTGASKGIGASIARLHLSKDAANTLVAIARSKDALEELQKKYGENRVKILVADVADPKTADAAVDLAVENFGGIDSVVANAGVLDPVDAVSKADFEKWRRLFEINFFSVAQLVQAALPYLKKSHGKVVAVSSGASIGPSYGWGAYGASKAALNHFISTVAEENADVLAISIAPGVVATDMQKDIRETFGKNMTEGSLQRFLDLHKNGQLLHPDVPANILVNLANNGWSAEFNGKYFRCTDDCLKDYAS